MANDNDALTAARFGISIDGVQIAGQFATLFSVTSLGVPQRELQVSELPLLCDNVNAPVSGRGSLRGPGASARPAIALKRGTANRALIDLWRLQGARDIIVLAGGNAANTPVARYKLTNAWPSKMQWSSRPAAGGTDVAMEQIVIVHEGMRRS